MRLLVAEDEPDLAGVLRRGLCEDGYAVDVAPDGEDALWRISTVEYDAVVLDLGLPRLDGLGVLSRARAAGRDVPVLILTARDAVEDRVRGLDLGADDYLVKPFAWDELTARVRALVRRRAGVADGMLACDGVELDPARHVVVRDEEPVDLTPKEFQILRLLMSDPIRVFTRTEIVEHVYDEEHDGSSNTVDVLVGRIRKKLRTRERCSLIRTVRGVGYSFRDADA